MVQTKSKFSLLLFLWSLLLFLPVLAAYFLLSSDYRVCFEHESPDKRFVLRGTVSWRDFWILPCQTASGRLTLFEKDGGSSLFGEIECRELAIMQLAWKSNSVYFSCLYEDATFALPPLPDTAPEGQRVIHKMHLFEEAAALNDTETLRRLSSSLPTPPNFVIDGRVPLSSATQAGAVEATQVLLDLGADPNFAHQRTAGGLFRLTLDDYSFETIEILLRLLVEKDFDMNQYHQSAGTLFDKATDLRTFRLLVSKGGDIALKTPDGKTLLFSAQTLEVARYLVDQGVDWRARNNFGDTAHDYRCVSTPRENRDKALQEVCEYLSSLNTSTAKSSPPSN